MPDHGIRQPSYTGGILGQAPYGWQGTPPYRAELLPASSFFPSDQFAYERVDYDNFQAQGKSFLSAKDPRNSNVDGFFSNPPFMGAAQILAPGGHVPEWMLTVVNGKVQPARILRGFMRRQMVDPQDPDSYVRLNFMWNPDELERQYVRAQDTNVSDIANITGVNPTNSPIAIAIVQATFSLFFDRQAEVAAVPDHPGVLVDLQAFDILSGKVAAHGTQQYKPDPLTPDITGSRAGTPAVDVSPSPNGESVALAPTFVAAVFSPNLAFYGQLTGATATFTKFSHRMTPTAMRLTITMNLVGVGNLNKQTADVNTALGSDQTAAAVYNPALGAAPSTPEEKTAANEAGPPAAMLWGKTNMLGTDYTWTNRMDGPPCNTKPTQSDCSSFVYRCFYSIGWNGLLGWGTALCSAPNTKSMQDTILARKDVWDVKQFDHGNPNLDATVIMHNQDIINNMKPGDLVIRGATAQTAKGGTNGHVAFYYGSTNGTGSGTPTYAGLNLLLLESTPSKVRISPARSGADIAKSFNYWARARPYR